MRARTVKAEDVLKPWQKAWEPALATWSRFTKLQPPRWCLTAAEEETESLSGSFAMIRLADHAVVISLRQIVAQRLEGFAREILAHEIGHHVYTPGDLVDNARLIARIRGGLANRERQAPLVANLYADLLINDRLQRSSELDMAGVYKKLETGEVGGLWTLYMRIYEILWNLPPATLARSTISAKMNVDAALGAKVVRVYAKDWLAGAGRFAVLCLPYLLQDKKAGKGGEFDRIFDTRQAGYGEEVPDGLTSIDEGELEGAIHPAEDDELTGLGTVESDGGGEKSKSGQSSQGDKGQQKQGGNKNRYRSPQEYRELLKSVGAKIDEDEIAIRYYRERARPFLIRFPVRKAFRAGDPLPEGLDNWSVGEPLADLDWMETIAKSPQVIPGVTTVRRTFGVTDGASPEKKPLDLYLGIDCSGSMANPRRQLSYPVLAGTIILLSALRTGARVMACLSGEPGKFVETDGFIRSEGELLKLLTGYLGTGYAYGVTRLKHTILDQEKPDRPTHLLVVTDADIFYMLDEVKPGWDIIREAAAKAGGGATFLLDIPNPGSGKKEIAKLVQSGWHVHLVSNQEEMIAFARAFAKERYQAGPGMER
ncbi:MAG: VWA domain-containing protein [Gammaproteobacteria bacterium]|nr:VWA domain-containing protein [Gammaproteobacteria bacterium]